MTCFTRDPTMQRFPHLTALLLMLPACAIERIEAILEAHGMTYNTTDVPDDDTSGVDSSTGTTSDTSIDTTDAMSGTVSTADGGHEASGEPGTGTGTTGTTTGTTTGDPTPVCGNGLLEPLSDPPEECDDGNQITGDGCDETCAADRIIFVSGNLYQAGYLEGLHVADGLCVNEAIDVPGLPRPLEFRAWLSDSATDARDRFTPGRGRIVLVNGLVVADSWEDLLAGALQTPIEVTADGETYHGPVWTGTRPDGLGVPGANHCDDWTSYSLNKSAHYGYSDRITGEWTLSAEFDNPFPCNGDFAVYCLQ